MRWLNLNIVRFFIISSITVFGSLKAQLSNLDVLYGVKNGHQIESISDDFDAALNVFVCRCLDGQYGRSIAHLIWTSGDIGPFYEINQTVDDPPSAYRCWPTNNGFSARKYSSFTAQTYEEVQCDEESVSF